ncbi:MAG: multidrug efflux SMR transporter [Pseudomonadota bacterium]
MAWLILFTAGVLEIIWAMALKQSDGFTKLVPMLIVWPTAGASFWLLALAMRSLPAGTAYAVWTGIGAVGVATIEIIMGGAPTTAIRLVSIAAIIAGIVGLRLSSMS